MAEGAEADADADAGAEANEDADEDEGARGAVTMAPSCASFGGGLQPESDARAKARAGPARDRIMATR